MRLPARISPTQLVLVFIYVAYMWIPIRRKLLERAKRQLLQCRRPYHNVRSIVANEAAPGAAVEEEAETLCAALVPPLSRAGRNYYILSTCLHAVIFVQNTFVNFTTGDTFNGSNPYVCHMPKLFVHKALGPEHLIWVSWLLGLWHLVWRSLMLLVEHKFDLDLIPFLLIDPQTIRQAIDKRRFNSSYDPLRKASDPQWSIFDELLFFKTLNKRTQEFELHLRPNRTPEAQAKLLKLMGTCAEFTLNLILAYSLIAVPAAVYTIFFAQETAFVGCPITIFDLAYFSRCFVSGATSVVIYFDAVLALFLPTTIVIVFTADLLIYWSDIETRLARLKSLVLFGYCRRAEAEVVAGENWPPTRSRDQQPAISAVETLIEAQSLELQASMRDFFDRLRCVDQYVSVLLAFSITVWLSIYGLFVFTGLPTIQGIDTAIIRAVQIIGFCVVTSLSHMVLKLKRRTEPAYKTLCSVMALASLDHKRHWSGVLKFYTDYRYAYTMVHGRLYTQMVYHKAVSYTFTLFFFIDKIKTSMSANRRAVVT